MTVKITDHQEDLRKSIKLLLAKNIYVGIPMSTADRADGKITNAALGYIEEYGSPVNNIPARPFLVPGVESVRQEIEQRMKGIAKLALKGKPEQIGQEQNSLGMVAVNAVQTYLSDPNHFAPLAASTIAARKRRGRQPPYSPLIDTGALRRSVTFVVRNT